MPDPLQAILNGISKDVTERYESTNYVDSYCAFIDILGMKDLVSEPYDVLRKIFNAIEESVILYSRTSLPGGTSFISSEQVKVTIISDAIVLSISSSQDHALSKLIGFSSYIIQKFLSAIDRPVFVRGAIVRGDLFQDANVVFGPALVEAYTLETQVAGAMRCILAKQLSSDASMVEYLNSESHGLTTDPEDGLLFIKFIRPENSQRLQAYTKEVLEREGDERILKKHQWLRQYIEREGA